MQSRAFWFFNVTVSGAAQSQNQMKMIDFKKCMKIIIAIGCRDIKQSKPLIKFVSPAETIGCRRVTALLLHKIKK